MKKTYINPKMEIVMLRHQQQLMAGSAPMYNQDATGPGLSRGYYYEDDEE